jgi:hypothetical protein
MILASDETAKLGRRLDVAELNKIGLSTEGAKKAYHSWVDTRDIQWISDNNQAYKAKIKAGFNKEIYHIDTEFSQPARVFDTAPTEEIHTVYDVINKAFKSVSKSELTKLYDDGHRVAKLESAITKISKEAGETAKVIGTDFVLLRKGSKVLARDLPKEVLGYIPGSFKRTFTDNYFVIETIPDASINGRKPISGGIEGFARAVYSSPTKREAEAAVEHLNSKAHPGVKYEWRHDKNFTKDQNAFFTNSYATERGTSWKHRGKGLSTVDSLLGNEHGIDRMADIQHPMKAMENSIVQTAKNASHQKTMDAMKSAWLNSYREFTQEGKFPIHEGLITGPVSSKLKEARAAYRSIARLERIDDVVGRTMRGSLISFSEWLGDKGMPKLSSFVAANKDVNPLHTARSLNFFRMIAANPIKQWFLQPSQLLFTAGAAPKYVFSGKLIKDMNFAHLGLLLKNMPEKSLLKNAIPPMSVLAKGFGVSEKEFNNILNAMEKSGILYVDSHAFLKNVSYRNMSDLYNSSIERGVASIANDLKKVNKVFTDIGFNPAEKINMMGHWLIARDRVLSKNPSLLAGSRAFQEEVAAEARGISLGMKHGFAYSDNQFTAMATQFMTFQHKTWLAILGNNKYFTPTERVGLAFTQAVLWGTTGLGLKSALDGVVAKFGFNKDNQSPAVKQAIEVAQSGLMEKMIGGVLTASGIDDMKISWAENFSIGNMYQNNIIKTAYALFSGEKAIGADLLFGPTSTTFSALQDMLGTAAFIFQTRDISSADFWKMELKNASTILPLMSRVFQFHVALNTGLMPNSKGTYFQDTTMKEAAWYLMTGMQAKDKTAFFEVMDLTDSGKKAAAENDAKVIYDHISKITTVLSAEDLSPQLYELYDKKLKETTQYLGTVLTKTDPFYRAGIEKELGKLISDDPKRGKDSLLYKLSRFYAITGQEGEISLNQLYNIKNKADDLKLTAEDRQAIDSIISYYKESLAAFSQQFNPEEKE